MTEYESEAQEPAESFNQQATHRCARCDHEWEYTGDAERPTCPSCSRKLHPEERLGEPTEFTIVDLSGAYGDGPRFDVDATIDTEEETGEVMIRLGLTKEEAEAMWEKIRERGHDYPEDARERVLEAMNYNVQTASQKD